MNKNNKQKFILSAALLIAATVSALAQDEINLRHRRCGRAYRRREGIWKILIGRPRYVEDGGVVVRGVYLPYRGGNDSPLVLPLI